MLTVKEKLSYGVGAVGKDLVYALVSGFLLYYYNAVLGISATFIGILFMVARVFDAFNDPFMGVIVQYTKSPWGKFRPWIMGGTVINALVLYALFSIPEGLSGNSLLIWISVAYVIWGITYTMMDIPYWSLIPAITKAGKERESISVIARSFAGFGFAIPIALTMALVPLLGNGSEHAGFSRLAAIIAVLFVIFIGITVSNVKEKVNVIEKPPRVKEMLKSLLRNDQALVVVVSIVIFNASLYLTQQLAIYFFRFDIGNAALFGVFGTIGGATQILAMMFVPVLRKYVSRKRLLVGAILLTIVGYSLLFALGVANVKSIVPLAIAASIIFTGFGIATVLTTIFLADSVDYGEWKNDMRSESVIFSLQTFVVKLSSAISVFIAGVGLDLIGLDPDAAVQTQETLFGLRMLMIVIPMIGLIISILFFVKRFKLTEEKLSFINGELEKRRAI
ncbi:MAG: glycoside-pentoside-hexuronide (GPH):cation symporter [Anaerobacillus sp.]|uniref:glycoside-pentoside-hexuronide (GPH):cation symporter n=1 Tax=Anaerobacillus sp. TaxID=1872506 RepID=UPI003919D71A